SHYVHSIWRDRCSFSKKSSDYFDVIMEWLNGLSTLEKDGTDLFAVTARALSESDYYMSNSQDMDRIELEFIRGFEPPGPKLQLLLFSADEARLRDVDVVVGVLMDLSRFSEQRLEADRKFVAVDTDNFDHVIRGKKCRLSFKVRNLLNGQGDLAVDLQVRTLDDLNPRQVAKQVIQLARLLKDRRSLAALAAFTDVHRDRIATLERILGVPDGAAALRSKIAALTQDLHIESPPTERSAFDNRLQAWITDLANESGWDEVAMGFDALERWQVHQPGQCVGDGSQGLRRLIDRIDGLIDRQLDPILHHKDFQQFESTWRGLWHLVTSFRGDRRVRIRCIDASKEELFLEQADPALDKPLIRDNSIYSKLAMEKEWEFGEPYNVVIADYRFTGSSEDLAVLGYLQKMAAKIDAVIYAPVEPDMFGFQSWEKLDAATVGNLAWPAGIAERFERAPHNRHLVLCAPEILGRPAYTRSPEGIGDFQYTESGEKVDPCLWCRPAFWAAEADIRQRLSEKEAELQLNLTTNGMSAALMEERPAIVPKYAWDAFVREALRRLGVETPPFIRDPSVTRSFQEG
ncbi:MAG: type VI secretion system contractile sheath domain-containing protein, partial [Anaerolineales bacterium]